MGWSNIQSSMVLQEVLLQEYSLHHHRCPRGRRHLLTLVIAPIPHIMSRRPNSINITNSRWLRWQHPRRVFHRTTWIEVSDQPFLRTWVKISECDSLYSTSEWQFEHWVFHPQLRNLTRNRKKCFWVLFQRKGPLGWKFLVRTWRFCFLAAQRSLWKFLSPNRWRKAFYSHATTLDSLSLRARVQPS
jgi:hypothetical protein